MDDDSNSKKDTESYSRKALKEDEEKEAASESPRTTETIQYEEIASASESIQQTIGEKDAIAGKSDQISESSIDGDKTEADNRNQANAEISTDKDQKSQAISNTDTDQKSQAIANTDTDQKSQAIANTDKDQKSQAIANTDKDQKSQAISNTDKDQKSLVIVNTDKDQKSLAIVSTNKDQESLAISSTESAAPNTENSKPASMSDALVENLSMRKSFLDDCDFSDLPDYMPTERKTGSLDIPSILRLSETEHSGVRPDGISEAFLHELANMSLPKVIPEESPPATSGRASLISQKSTSVAAQGSEDIGYRCIRSWYEFSRVRPLHMCAAHSFVCFRDNGDLVALTPACVYIYDKPPAACEITYKEPLYSISVSNVFRVADLSDNSILLLRQGSFQITAKRASDELLVAEVGINAVSLLVKIALPQTVISTMHSMTCNYPVLRERSSQSNSVECRGMQVNKKEHKVYLLYDYHLAVIDLDMRLEPVILRLRCNDIGHPPYEQTGPAVALMEFDHAVYILTSKLCLLGTNKTRLFAQDPSSCCMAIVQTLIEWRQLAANEICSYVVDRCHYTAFFSVPNGRKLVSLRFSVPAMLNDSLDFEPASAPLLQNILVQDRLYSDANNKDWAAAVPWSLAWDSTTQQLLVLEWGSENNGVLISLDVCLEEDSINGATQPWIGGTAGAIHDRFLIVKTFSRCQNNF